MILSFTYPSSPQYTGGVVALYEFANGMTRRGHEVHFLHGPASPYRVDHLDELDWFRFEPEMVHHLVDSLDDPGLPRADVVFAPGLPRRLGEPAAIVQGHGMVPAEMDRAVFRARCPKLCVAGWLVEVGEAYGVPRAQLLDLPYGIDHDLFRPATSTGERTVDVAILFNAHPAKGWPVALRTLERVRRGRPDLQVTAFGILPPEDGLPDWIRFYRGLDRAALVRDVYDQARVFLQPSWFEGFGFTAVEAMASGCALVTTDNGGSRDYAVPGETALVASPGDDVALAAAVASLLADPVRCREVAEAGGRLVPRFDWDRSAARLESHLQRYLADPEALQAAPGEGDGPPPRILG